MKAVLRVLIVEDSENDAMLILYQIKQGGYSIVSERVESATEMQAALANESWDIILSDYQLPGFNGLEALALYKKCGLDIPFFIISGNIGEDIAVEAMKAGAHDYILKNNMNRLLPAIERELKESHNRVKIKILEEKQKEAETIKKSELKFQNLVSDMHVGVMIMDAYGEVTLINNKITEFLGLTEKQISGIQPKNSEWKIVYEDKSDFPGFNAVFKQIVETGQSIRNVMVEVFRPEINSITWIMIDAVPQFNNNNELQQVVWTFVDRTERKKANEALRESEELYHSILIASPDDITITDLEGKIITVSPSALYMFGYESADEIKGRSVMEFIAPGDVDNAINAFERMFSDNERDPKEYIGLKKDGSVFDIEVNGEFIKDSNGNPIKIVFIVRDISKRKQDELELSKLSKAIEQSPTSIIITNKWGIIEYVNPFFTRITGYTKEEAIGKNPRILNSGNTSSEVFSKLWKTIESGNIWRGELCNKKKNGEIYWEWASISPFINSKGQITHYIGVKEDITKRKLIEDEIKDKNEELTKLNLEKDKFFSIIAHDLRSPFSTFLGMTELLVKKLSDISQEQLLLFVTSMKDSAGNLYQLLENLLQWANAQQGKFRFNPEPLNVLHTIKDSIEAISNSAQNKNVNIEYNIDENIGIMADLNMFQTIIRNLVSNAIKFTPTNGRVIISAVKELSNLIKISIKDTGIGMDDHILGNLFKLDVKINREGTEGEPSSGLGLLLCKDFVEKHNGNIWAESVEGEGATFYFTITSN